MPGAALRELPRNADGFVAVCSKRGCPKLAWHGDVCSPGCEGRPDPPILVRHSTGPWSASLFVSSIKPTDRILRCAWCMKDFTAKRRHAKTCSPECRRALFKYRHEFDRDPPENGWEHLKAAAEGRS
jgi:hypothetical protein